MGTPEHVAANKHMDEEEIKHCPHLIFREQNALQVESNCRSKPSWPTGINLITGSCSGDPPETRHTQSDS